MADIEVTFEADDGPIRGVIGRLSREIINFAKRSEIAFGGVQSGLQGIGRAGSLSERALEGQRKQLEAIQKASRFEAKSSLGFDDRQIAEVQRALSSSTREARDLSKEFSQQNSFLRDQVAQYDRVLAAQRRVNDLVGQQGGVRAIEAQARPQLTSQPTNTLGLTDGQIAAIQAALAQSVTSARELTQEFIRQNAAVSQSKDIVVRQSSEMQKFGEQSASSFDKANKGAVLLASEFGVLEGELQDSGDEIEKFAEDIIDAEVVAEDLGENISKSGQSAKSGWRGLFDQLGTGDLPALRYALYDIGNNLQRIGIAIGAASIAPLIIAAQYEREFANVIRTNDLARDDVADLRNSLRQDLQAIAQSTPINWKDITQIATLAGQLGIAQESVANFTETVAKFSATTNLSVDEAATAFGRLDQLIAGIDGNFNNLGSAILAVGVDSVATESAIVNVAQQIASMSNLAGLAAPEIIGLAGSLASLGIQPELARGTITRLFSTIGEVTTTSGAEVGEFGRLTGRTAAQFTEDWGTRPGEVLQDFFDGINQEGPEAERVLRSLGITSVRDIPAILRLAQSSDEVRRLIRLSTAEYIRGTEVTEQYGIISSTVSAQITRLGQNFEILQSSVGDSVNLFGGLIGILNLVVQGYNTIIDTPFGAAIFGILIAIGLVAAGFAIMVAQAAFFAAAALAVAFVMRKLGISLDAAQIKELLFSKSVTEANVALYNQAVASGASKLKLDALAISLNKAQVGAKLFRGALRSLLITSGVGIALLAVGAAIGFFAEKAAQAEAQSEDLFGSLEGLGEALIKDGKEFDETTGKMKDGSDALRVYRKDLDEASDSLVDYLKPAGENIDSQGDLTDSITETNEALEKQEELLLAAGNNVFEFFKASALRDEDLVRFFGDPRILQAAQDTGTRVRQLFEDSIAGIDVGPQLDVIGQQLEQELSGLQVDFEAFDFAGGRGSEEALAVKAEIEEIEALLLRLEGARIFLGGISPAIAELEAASDGTEAFGEEMATSAELAQFLREDLEALNDVLFQEARFIKGVEDSLGGLATAFAEGSDEAQLASGAIGDVVDKILNDPTGNVDNILGNLNGLLVLLELQGPKTAVAQEFVRASIEATGAQANIDTPDILAYAAALNATANFDAANFQELMAAALDKVGTSSDGAAGKVQTLAEKFDDLVDSMFEAINLGRDAEDAIFSLGEAFGETGDQALYASEEMQDAIGAILGQSDSAEQGVANLAALFSKLASVAGGESAPSLRILRQAISQVGAQFGISEEQIQRFIATAGGGLANINVDNFTRGVQSAQKEVRTLLDFAGDLEDVFSRAFDIRFARTTALDDIAESFEKLAEQVEDARFELEELQASQSDLSADRGLKQYFLSIAEAYGDTVRAAQLRKEIAELDREQAKNAREIQEAQQIAGGDLTSQGPGSRQNRQALLGLVGNYQDYITALAESGASQNELRDATEQARQEFIEQARELGFQEQDIQTYAAAFDDVRTAIDNVPRNITVEANVNPALQALNELNAALNKNIEAARNLNAELGLPRPTTTTTTTDRVPPAMNLPGDNLFDGDITGNISAGAFTINAPNANLNLPLYTQGSFGPGYSQGGYTGRGGMMEPAGIVHRGEYVVPKQYVNQSTGMPDPSFLAQMQSGMRNYFMGGFVGGSSSPAESGPMMVELSPYDRKLLADAGNVQLRLNGKIVAEATNRANLIDAQRGTN